MSYYYHVCLGCAAYFTGSAEDAAEFEAEHVCRERYPRSFTPTMRPFEEAIWVKDKLQRAGGVAVLP